MRDDDTAAVDVVLDGAVVRATIDRPATRNAIDEHVIDGLERAVALATERAARVLVIRGAGGTFCAGADLRTLEGMLDDPGRVDAFMARLSAVLDTIEAAPFAALAVVEGHAVAGGCELLLACDIAVASTTARIGDRHAEYGLAPAAGASVRLSRTLPAARSRYLLLTGDLLTGSQAADWGLVTWAVPPEELDAVASRIIERLASRSADALRTTKAMTAAAAIDGHGQAVAQERQLFISHVARSPDVREGLAAFRHHRSPDWP